MKKIIIMAFIILLFPSIFLFAETESGETPNQWDKNKKTGSESFTVYFDLNDTDTSDLYSNIGFSKTPFSNGNITSYDGNTLQASWKGIQTSGGETSVSLSATTYAYWHVVVPGNYKISLKKTPSSDKVAVKCSFYAYEDDKKKALLSVNDYSASETIPIAVFSKAGRYYGSTEITIDAELKEYAFVDDIFCTLTLVMEVGT